MTDDTSDSSSSARQQQLDEILAALMRADDDGETVDREQWLAQHPEFAAELDEFFAKNERLERLVRPLRQAAAHVLHVRCPHCHNPIELLDEVPLSDISCPSCGSSFSLIGDQTMSHDARMKSFGHFELLDRVGMGQFGSVWKARDTKLDRTVAIKIPRNARMDAVQTEMFLRDASAAAQLKHPNIVSVHEVGKQDDTIYIVSDFIQGATLKEWTDAKRLTPREAAELCAKIAKALHHAHEAGVIHRDLKPSNIMLDTDGEPHIVDFGLAKRDAGEITMTVEGQILGTPAYMSPEQARGEGHRVNRCADIYSLGVILFELLTGELPFRGDKQMLLVQILQDDPPSPRRLNNLVPRDLETICLKCLAKDPAGRYESARSVVDDLSRWLIGISISARPVATPTRLWRWSRRNPTVAGLLSVSAMLVLLVALVSTLAYFREAKLRHDAQIDRLDATEAKRSAESLLGDLKTAEKKLASVNTSLEQNEADLAKRRRDLSRALENLDTADTKVAAQNLTLERHRVELVERRRDLARTLVRLAAATASSDDLEKADDYLSQCPTEFRGWDWRLFKQVCNPHVRDFEGRSCVAFSPTGATLAAGGQENQILLIQMATGRTLKSYDNLTMAKVIAFSPDGRYLASGSKDAVRLWDLDTDELHTLASSGNVRSISFDNRGDRLVSQAVKIDVWDVRDRRKLRSFEGDHGVISPDGLTLATEHSHILEAWDLSDDSNEPIASLDLWDKDPLGEDLGEVQSLAFSPDGKSVAVGCDIGFSEPLQSWDDVRVWKPITNQLQRFSGRRSSVTINDADLRVGRNVAFSHDGKWLACLRSTAVKSRHQSKRPTRCEVVIWNLQTGFEERVFPWEAEWAEWIAFSPDGMWIAAADKSRVKLWRQSMALEPLVVPGFMGTAVYSVSFSSDGRYLAAGGSNDRQEGIGILDVVTGKERARLGDKKGDAHCIRFSRDGEFVAVADAGQGVTVWRVATGEIIIKAPGKSSCIAFSNDNTRCVFSVSLTPNAPMHILVWDLANRRELHRLATPTSTIYGMAISTDNSRVYVNVGRAVACWDVADGKEIYRTQTIDSAYRLALSPDGSRIAIGEAHGHIEIFNAESGDRISEWSIENGEYILEVAFSPDGELLATAEAEVGHIPTPVRVWDVDTGYQLVGLRSPSDSGACYSVAFSHDGRTLAAGWGTTNKQERILLWDTALGMESLSYQWLPKVVAKAEASNE